MQPLADLKVLDLTWHVAGPYCTKLLADYGADVIKVERPGLGDPARAYGPFPDDDPHLERSGMFLHLNANKRSVTVDLKSEDGRLIVKELARWADIVVESFSPGKLTSLDLDYNDLKAVNPQIIMCSVTSFGQVGPYANWKATEFTISSMAGLNLITGVPEMHPLKSADHLQEYQGGSMASFAIMAAVMQRNRNGRGQHIDISIHEVANDSADRRHTLLTGYAYSGRIAAREGSLSRILPMGIYPCADGYIFIVASPTARWPRFMEMVGRSDLINEPELQDSEFWGSEAAAELVASLFYPWVLERTKQEVMEAGQAAKVPVTPVNSTLEVLADAHLNARGYFVEAEHPDAGSLPYTGPSVRKLGEGWQLRCTAPRLGQHNQEVFGGYLGFATGEMVLLREMGAI